MTLDDVKPKDWIEFRQERKRTGVHGWTHGGTHDCAAGAEGWDFWMKIRVGM